MSPVEKAVLQRKLERITTNLRALDEIGRLSVDEYFEQDLWHRKGAERLLHEIVEAAVDINAHLLVQHKMPAPDSMYESFLKIGEAGLIDRALAKRLAPSAGLRNRLVHEYDAIDEGIIHGAIRLALRDYTDYVAAIEAIIAP